MQLYRAISQQIQKQVQDSLAVKAIILKISGIECQVGKIHQNKLQIFTDQYNLRQLRSYEDEILRAAGRRFAFNIIQWRILVQEEKKQRQKISRSVSSEQANYVSCIAKKCQHEGLKSALTNLAKTINQSSTIS